MFSSMELMALMWAKGQKLLELCGKTTNNRIMAGVKFGNAYTNTADKQKVRPALPTSMESITLKSPDFIRTAIPMNNNTKGVIKAVRLRTVF